MLVIPVSESFCSAQTFALPPILLYRKPYATHYRVSCERAQVLQQVISSSMLNNKKKVAAVGVLGTASDRREGIAQC